MMQRIKDEELPDAAEYIQSRNGVDFIPSSIMLSVVEAKLRLEMGAERMLAGILEPLKERYDYILVDTCPSLGSLTINALSAADGVIITVNPQLLAMMGLQDFLKTVKKIRGRINPGLHVEGILLTMCDARRNGLKGIGFRLEDGSIYDGNFDLMVMGEMQTEFINEIPQYRNSPLVQKAIADMEAILLEQTVGREAPDSEEKVEEPQQPMPGAVQMEESQNQDKAAQESFGDTAALEKQSAEPEKAAENALKTDRNISGDSKKQSVLNALRERQARLKTQGKENPGQEKQGQKAQAKKKGEPEL